MTKIAIVTIYGNDNFGNKLQNLALQKIVEKNNCEVTTVRYHVAPTNSVMKNIYIAICSIKTLCRRKKIKRFSDQYLKTSEIVYDVKDKELLKKYLNSFDYVLVGSDQVWNSTYLRKELLEYFLLSTVVPAKRIAAAPSVAENFIKDVTLFKRELPHFKAISCREIGNIEQLEEISGKIVVHLSDPTIAVGKDFWNRLIDECTMSVPSTKYKLIYTLGQKKITTVDAINILDRKSKYYNIDPIGFIKLIKYADEVITDSYHATIFSIILNTKVRLIERKGNMSERIKSLFQDFNIEENTRSITIQRDTYSEIEDSIKRKWEDYLNQSIVFKPI